MRALNPKSIKEDLDGLISELIGKGICDDANFSAVRSYGNQADVTFSGSEHISIALGDIEYAEIYSELADKRSYNMKLVAYSRPRLPLIPDEACHPFHAKAATDSTAKLPPWQAA
jgi:hypothetical protein